MMLVTDLVLQYNTVQYCSNTKLEDHGSPSIHAWRLEFLSLNLKISVGRPPKSNFLLGKRERVITTPKLAFKDGCPESKE